MNQIKTIAPAEAGTDSAVAALLPRTTRNEKIIRVAVPLLALSRPSCSGTSS